MQGGVIIYSFADFLKEGFVPELRLMTGPMDFHAIPVTGSSVQEFPLDDFIQSGEIVLSTAIGYHDQPDFFKNMIRGACAAGAAAIAFSFRDSNYLLPEDAAAFANDCGIPVFQMPWEYRFSDFQASLRDAIWQKEVTVYHSIQDTLFDYFFETRPIEQAIGYLGRMLRCVVKIESLAGETIATSEPILGKSVEAQIEINIQIGNTVFNRLKFYTTGGIQSLPKQEILEKYVAFPLSLWFYHKIVEDTTTARLKNDFVWKLAMNEFSSEEEMLRQGGYLCFRLNRSYSCIAMRYILQMNRHMDTANPWESMRYSTEVEKMLVLEARRKKQNVMVGSRSTEAVIYFENSGALSAQKISAYIDSVEETLEKKFPELTCYWGISENYQEQAEFSCIYKNAKAALQCCIHSKANDRRFTYQKTKKTQIISLLCNSVEMQDNACRLMQRIAHYSTDSRIDLLNTLSTYIQANYNASKTARNLHLNRQSLLRRLEKIEGITGMSLTSHDDLFVLEVFLNIYSSM